LTWLWALCLAGAILISPALASEPAGPVTANVPIHVGLHPGFGRIVFDVAPDVRYRLSRDGDKVEVRFPDGINFGSAPAMPSNVRTLRIMGNLAEILVAPGATTREMRVAGHVVIDILNPKSAPAVSPAADQAASPPKVVANAEPPVIAPVTKASEPQTAVPSPSPTQAPPHAAADTQPPATGLAIDGAAFTIPMGPRSGAASFRQGKYTYVVFDERRPIDLAALSGNAMFGATTVRELEAGTLFALRPPVGMTVALTSVPRGWKIALQTAAAVPRPVAVTVTGDKLLLASEAPGAIVTMADPDSAATLLVGTVTVRNAPQAVLAGRRTPEFSLLPTLRGVVVEPIADTVALRVVPMGFMLSSEPAGLMMTTPSPASGAMSATMHLTRRFNIPAFSAEALRTTLTRGVADSAVTPPQARGPKRRAAASAMLALGMPAEAQALLRVAAEQDPREAASPDTIGLTAIAAMLAGRPDEATGIAEPALTGTDETEFWRAILLALREDGTSSAAAASFATNGPLALLYSPGIRDRVLPLVLETMILGGEPAAAKRLLALAHDSPGLGFAQALLQQANGNSAAALAALDVLSSGHDRLDRARAAPRAIEVRLSEGQLDAGLAAEALEKLRNVWRGDRRELALRERIADLRQRSGGWRPALAELRLAEADFPKQAAGIHAHLSTMFASLLEGEAANALTPLDLIAMVDENADLLRDTPERTAMEERLADRLLALDLPGRAGPLLQKLAGTAQSGERKAGLGLRLAELRLREDDPAGATAALVATDASDLAPALTEQRAVLASAAHARRGDTTAAIADLAPLSNSAADAARASVYEHAEDWPAAQQALEAFAAKAVPDSGELDDTHRRILVRLATAAARAGDTTALAALRRKEASRIGTGPLGDMFRLLTVEAVRATADVSRARQEIGLAGAIPAGLAAFRPQ
jgi:hypothetical protein